MGKNIIVTDREVDERMKELLFGPLLSEDVIEVIPELDIWEVLVSTGSFPSRSQARKNWNDFNVGKLKYRVCIWVIVPDSWRVGTYLVVL